MMLFDVTEDLKLFMVRYNEEKTPMLSLWVNVDVHVYIGDIFFYWGSSGLCTFPFANPSLSVLLLFSIIILCHQLLFSYRKCVIVPLTTLFDQLCEPALF